MELNQLICFRTAAKYQHFTQAANKLFITQPTLSKTISRLEEELGVQLFDRVGSYVQLNAYGELFLRCVDSALSILEDGKRELKELKHGEAGTISFATNIIQFIGNTIAPYLTDHSKIHMQISSCNNAAIIDALINRKVDFALSNIEIRHPAINWCPIVSESVGIIVSVNHPLADKGAVDLSELKNERFLINNSNEGLRQDIISFCANAGFEPDIFFEGESSTVIYKLTELNMGISFIPKSRYSYLCKTSKDNDFSKKVNWLYVKNPEYMRTTGLATLKGRTLSPAAIDFYNYLRSVNIGWEAWHEDTI